MQWDLWGNEWIKFSDWDHSTQMQIFNAVKDECKQYNNI